MTEAWFFALDFCFNKIGCFYSLFGWALLCLQAFKATVAKLLAQLPTASGSQRLCGGTARHPGGSALPWRGMCVHLLQSWLSPQNVKNPKQNNFASETNVAHLRSGPGTIKYAAALLSPSLAGRAASREGDERIRHPQCLPSERRRTPSSGGSWCIRRPTQSQYRWWSLSWRLITDPIEPLRQGSCCWLVTLTFIVCRWQDSPEGATEQWHSDRICELCHRGKLADCRHATKVVIVLDFSF